MENNDINLLLVDDEIAMVQILLKSICWKKLGISQVYFAYNAQEARKIILQKSIKIIICDIEMPQENGIQFLKWVQENDYGIINIILTGFPDFNYAKDAISIGVFKFLLKPIAFDEVNRVVEEAVKKVRDETRKENQRRYGEYYESNRLKAEKIFYRDLLFEEILPFRDYIEKEILRRGMVDKMLEPGGMVLFQTEQAGAESEKSILQFALENIAEEMFENVVVIGLGKEILWIIKGKCDEKMAGEMCVSYRNTVWDYLQYDLYAYITCDLFLEEIPVKYRMLKEAAGSVVKSGEKIFYSDKWIEGIIDDVTVDTGRNIRENKMIEEVKNYLENHFAESISRKDIEELVHMNQDYVNRIFKCSTGYSLMEYTQYYRILKSKYLLLNTEYSISEIGGMVGYDSPPYFSKIFKKWTGVTPLEYRSEGGAKKIQLS